MTKRIAVRLLAAVCAAVLALSVPLAVQGAETAPAVTLSDADGEAAIAAEDEVAEETAEAQAQTKPGEEAEKETERLKVLLANHPEKYKALLKKYEELTDDIVNLITAKAHPAVTFRDGYESEE